MGGFVSYLTSEPRSVNQLLRTSLILQRVVPTAGQVGIIQDSHWTVSKIPTLVPHRDVSVQPACKIGGASGVRDGKGRQRRRRPRRWSRCAR